MMKEGIEAIYGLSPMQQGLLFHTVLDPESGVYVGQVACQLKGKPDVAAFAEAWQRVVQRHPVLRTAFVWKRIDEPRQVVHERVTLKLERLDWRGLDESAREARVKAYLESDRKRGFELGKAPLMRLALIQFGSDDWVFVSSQHHILLDGWSLPLLLNEVFTFYEALRQGKEIDLPRPRPYRDYIAWLQRQDLETAKEYWSESLRGFTSPTRLGVELEGRDNDAAAAGGTCERQLQLSEEATAALAGFARRSQLTVNALVQGAWAFLLSRYSNKDDVLFGVVVSGRRPELPAADEMIGLFINTLPMRVRVSPSVTLLPWLSALQQQMSEMRQFDHTPLVKIERWSQIPRGVPLFETLLAFENYPEGDLLNARTGELTISDLRVIEQPNVPLTLIASPGKSSLSLRFLYNPARYAHATVETMLEHLRVLLERITENPERLEDLPILTGDEWRKLVDWNRTEQPFAHEGTLAELFETQVERTPDRVALECQGEQVTFQELNEQTNQLAHYLRSLGVRPECLVGICMERSAEAVISILGILKAGAAWVPLDPTHPRERLAYLLSDCRAMVVLTKERYRAVVPHGSARIVCLDGERERIAAQPASNPMGGAQPASLAYIMYTSGSTGLPKGVLGLQRTTLNRFSWMWEKYPFQTDEVCCQKTILTFGDSIWENLGPLLRGVRVVIVPDEVLADLRRYIELLKESKVSRLVLVPSLLRAMLDLDLDLRQELSALKYCVTSGEALDAELCRKFLDRVDCTLINLYGSCELAADATCYEVDADRATKSIPIGVPIANLRAYVLDQHMQPLPVGVTGELFVGGVGVNRGYINLPGATAERFVPDPFHREPGWRLYRTGDLARFLPDGNLDYLGRLDHQVQIRGIRVELGEVQTHLARHPGVKQCVVDVWEPTTGDKRLVAYIVSQEEPAPTMGQLREFLAERLPGYMLPGAVVQLDRIPVNFNGKVDRSALPEPEGARPEQTAQYVAPRTATEKELARIWCEVLHVDRVGIKDNFFELGGDSLLAMQVLSRMRKSFHVDPPLREVYTSPNIEILAELLDKAIVEAASQERMDDVMAALSSMSDEQAREMLDESS